MKKIICLFIFVCSCLLNYGCVSVTQTYCGLNGYTADQTGASIMSIGWGGDITAGYLMTHDKDDKPFLNVGRGVAVGIGIIILDSFISNIIWNAYVEPDMKEKWEKRQKEIPIKNNTLPHTVDPLKCLPNKSDKP